MIILDAYQTNKRQYIMHTAVKMQTCVLCCNFDITLLIVLEIFIDQDFCVINFPSIQFVMSCI